jgi:SpoVK/Ycf46/Vps4 family AAA+-type ATPase
MALIKAHVERDSSRFHMIAQQIASRDSNGKGKQIRRLLPSPVQLDESLPKELAGLLEVVTPKLSLAALVLGEDVRAELEAFLTEAEHATELRAAGIEPATKLLLVGPPGTGKTSIAGAIADALELALARLSCATVDGHMGGTSARLATVFREVSSVRRVYLFDEFDAIARARSPEGSGSAAEQSRIIASLITGIDGGVAGVLVAATNEASHMDKAVLRRFDAVIHVGLPDLAARAAMLIPSGASEWCVDRVAAGTVGLSHADIASCVRRARVAGVLCGGVDDVDATLEAAVRNAHRAKEACR